MTPLTRTWSPGGGRSGGYACAPCRRTGSGRLRSALPPRDPPPGRARRSGRRRRPPRHPARADRDRRVAIGEEDFDSAGRWLEADYDVDG
ncbi:hypothetical protein DZF96_12005, partial [Clavibacter michiganensis]